MNKHAVNEDFQKTGAILPTSGGKVNIHHRLVGPRPATRRVPFLLA